MSQHPLKELVRKHFDDVQLDEAQLRRLERVRPRPARWRRWALVAVALLTVAWMGLSALGAAYLLFPGSGVGQLEHGLAQRVADEVVRNHIAHPEVEIAADTFEDLRQPLADLAFVPVRGSGVSGELLGGRHCSLQGIPAAQLRLSSDAGERTLYLAPDDTFEGLPDSDAGESPVHLAARGVSVQIWREHGLVMVLTEPTP
ncbi:MAG: hypothetical protein KTR31_10975 [Myxococcales bacterium]|nr:hypothetical protein [Myxococcales bacterium]